MFLLSLGDACMHPYIKTVELNSSAWAPASMYGGIIRLPPNCAQNLIIPATNQSIYILLNAIQNAYHPAFRQYSGTFSAIFMHRGLLKFRIENHRYGWLTPRVTVLAQASA